jgi:hypothetical protein
MHLVDVLQDLIRQTFAGITSAQPDPAGQVGIGGW